MEHELEKIDTLKDLLNRVQEDVAVFFFFNMPEGII